MIQDLNLYLYCHILMQTGEGGWDNSFKPTLLPGKLNLIAANTATIRDSMSVSLQA